MTEWKTEQKLIALSEYMECRWGWDGNCSLSDFNWLDENTLRHWNSDEELVWVDGEWIENYLD